MDDEAILESLQNYGSKIKDQIADIQEAGTEIVPDSMYTQLELNANAQLKQIEKIKEAWLELARTTEDDTKKKEYVDNARAMDSAKDSAEADKRTGEEGKEENKLTKLETEATKVDNALEKIRKKINDSSKFTTLDDYNDALEESGNKLNNLAEQEAYWSDMLSSGVEEGSADWQTYSSNLKQVQDEIEATKEEQEAWNKAIDNFDADSIQRELDDYNKALNDLQNNIKMNEAKGIEKSSADYAAENELYDNIEKAAKSRADELQKNLSKDMKNGVIEENSADYFAAMQEIDAATQEAFNAAYSRVQNEHEEELLPINQLQDELGKLQVVGSEIQREFDNITAAGGEISDVQYSKQVDNLEDQREILELIADEYEKLATKHQNDSFGLEMMQALDGVQSQIDAIDDQEIDIQFQIDNRPLRHLQNEMTNLETEANKLKTQLDNTTTVSGKETIINKILGNNEEQKSNLAQQIAEYREQMKQIEDSYKGTENEQGYLTNSKYVDLVANIVSAENSMEGLIQSTIDYKKALENLPIERINKSVELNDARLNRAQSEIAVKEASGETVTKEDYSPILRAYEEDVRLKEESLRIATEAFNNAKHDYEEAGTEENLEAMWNANTDLINAQTELNNAEATLIKSQEEASNAALNAHDVRIRELQARKDEIEMARSINEASGVKRSKADIQNDYGMANKFRKEYEAELETFNNEHLGELTIDQLEQKLAIQKNINSAEQESLQYIKEMLEYDANQGQNVLEELEEDASRLDAGIAEIQRKGLEVPDITFDLKISNIEEQKEQVVSLINTYQGLMDKYGEEHPEWFEDWDDIIEGLRSKLQALDSELNQTREEKDNKSLTHLGYQLDDLKVKGEELQKVLNKEGSTKFASDYEKAIQNMVQQNQNLMEQAQELQTKMQGFNFNDSKYQEYKGQLDGIRSAQEANIDTLREWQKELDMLSFNKASESLNKYIEEMNKGLERQDNRVALGYRLTKDDLESNRAQYLHSQNSASRIAQNASAEMDKLERENPYSFWQIPHFQDLQEQYDAAIALEEEYKQKVEETNKEIVLFPVEELKREQEDIQRSYEEIERTIVELGQKGKQAPESLINQQMDIIDEETANLEDQIEKLEFVKIWADALGAKDFSKQVQDMIDDARNQIHSLADEKYELKIDLDQRPIEGYENKLKELEGYADLLQDSYDNPETASVSKDEALVRLKANAEQRKQIILDEIKYYRGELQKVLEVDPEATYATNDLYRENQDMINQLILKYNDVTRSVKEYGDAIKNLPVNRLQEQLENFGIRRSGLEAKNSVISALGGQEDMSGLLTIDSAATDITQRVVGEYKKRMEEAEQQLRQDTGSSIYGYLEEEYRKAVNEYFQKVDEFNSQQVQEINDRLAAGKQPITALENEMDVIKNKAASVQNEVNRLVESGATASEAQYNALIKYNDQEIENIDKQKAAWEDYRQVVIALLNEFGASAENSPLLNEIDAQINQLNMDTQALIDSTLEYELMLNGGRELAILSERMKELENEFSNINEEISNMESLGQNIPTKMYDGLIKNSRQQVYNLQSQNEYLRQQQNLVGDNKAKYAELEDQIRSNDSTIRGLLTNIDNYHNSIAHFATNAATALSSAVESALSESMSSTGLSNDTMNALMAQFKQLESVSNIDLRSMFIQSANGIQVNISALRKLIKAQGSLTKSNFANQVRVQNNELVRQVRAYRDTSNAANQDGRVKRNAAKQNLQGIKKEVKALDVEMNAYYALQKMMEERTSGYQKWQNALQTPNAGDHYKEVYSQMESITQALNMGEVGTDEWITFWRDYVSREGRHSSDYAREQWDWIYRYFTEDRSGVENFINDLVSRGFATLSNGVYSFDLEDTEALQRSFGWSDEFLKDIFGRLEDFGFKINYVTSYADGLMQVSDALEDIMVAEEWLSKADNDPWFTTDGLIEWNDELQAAINQYHNLIGQLDQQENAGIFTEDEYNQAVSNVNRLSGLLRQEFGENLADVDLNSLSEAQQMAYRGLMSKLLDIAEEYKLDLSSETFEVNLDTNSAEQSLARLQQMQNYTFESGKQQLRELQETWNTSADLDYEFGMDKDLDEMRAKLLALKDLNTFAPFDIDKDVQAMETLNRMIEEAQHVVDYKIVLDTNGLTEEEFSLLTEEEKVEAIRFAIDTHGVYNEDGIKSTIQEILGYADGLYIPTKVQIDEQSVETFGDTIETAVETAVVNALDKSFSLGIKTDGFIENIKSEFEKLKDFGLEEYASDILNGTMNSVFGNIDMNNRQVIEWTEEMIKAQEEALKSWNYTPEIGSIDTVFGGSDRFGEDKLEYGVEIAFSPILQTESGAQFLNQDTLYNYIETLIGESTENGHLNIDKLFELDAQGREVGGKFIQNVIAAADESIDENNEAIEIGKLMHYTGDFGAIEMEFEKLQDYLESVGFSSEEASAKVDLLKQQLADMGTLEVTTEVVNSESVDEVTEKMANSKTAKVLVDATKSDDFDNQFETIVDEVEAEKPEMNIDIKYEDTQVDTIITEIEGHEPPVLNVEISVNDISEQINSQIEAVAATDPVKIPIDGDSSLLVEEIQADKVGIEAESNTAYMKIDGDSELLITEVEANKTGIEAESNKANMKIDGDPELLRNTVTTERGYIESAPPANMRIGGDSGPLHTEVQNDINAIQSIQADIKVGADSTWLFNSIQNTLNNSTFTANVNANVNAQVNVTQLATGTATSISRGPAHAEGDIALKQDEDALVNELGNESIILIFFVMPYSDVRK